MQSTTTGKEFSLSAKLPVSISATKSAQALNRTIGQGLIIYGDGNLARLKLHPALLKLKEQGKLPENQPILVIDNKPLTTGSFRADLRQDMLDHGFADTQVEKSLPDIYYLEADLKNPGTYPLIQQQIESLKPKYPAVTQWTHYLAVWANLFPMIIENLGESNLLEKPSKIAIEKPFGEDLESAKCLIKLLNKYCDNDQMFPLDHYFTKQLVQQIPYFRFGNLSLAPTWDSRYIESVVIMAVESVTCKGRFDFPGLINDMAGHLLQILALLAMETPNSLDADTISTEKVKVLESTKIDLESVILGQYQGYKEEGHKLDNETCFVMKFIINNARWHGVPFILVASKATPFKKTQAIINLKPNLPPFADTKPNRLILDFHQEEIVLEQNFKVPSQSHCEVKPLSFSHQSAFNTQAADGYETILEAIFQGDHSLFVRPDEVLAIWKILMPLIERLSYNEECNGYAPIPIHSYPQGTVAPHQAMDLLRMAGL